MCMGDLSIFWYLLQFLFSKTWSSCHTGLALDWLELHQGILLLSLLLMCLQWHPCFLVGQDSSGLFCVFPQDKVEGDVSIKRLIESSPALSRKVGTPYDTAQNSFAVVLRLWEWLPYTLHFLLWSWGVLFQFDLLCRNWSYPFSQEGLASMKNCLYGD